jgi:flagellar basal body-associated protein FliL
MEARRTFQGAKSYRQLWIIVAALMVAAVLGIGGAFVASGLTSSGKAPQLVQTHAAPGTVLRQDYDRNSSAPVNSPSKPSKQTVF